MKNPQILAKTNHCFIQRILLGAWGPEKLLLLGDDGHFLLSVAIFRILIFLYIKESLNLLVWLFVHFYKACCIKILIKNVGLKGHGMSCKYLFLSMSTVVKIKLHLEANFSVKK